MLKTQSRRHVIQFPKNLDFSLYWVKNHKKDKQKGDMINIFAFETII